MTESGKAQEPKGRAKEAAGAVRGDDEQRAEGREDQAEGKIRQAGEKVRDAVEDVKDAARAQAASRPRARRRTMKKTLYATLGMVTWKVGKATAGAGCATPGAR